VSPPKGCQLPVQRHPWIALLGRRDEPTDALEDYCGFLATALHNKGYSLEVLRVPWAEKGWRRALKALSEHLAQRRRPWLLVQYTSLAWSRHGIPLGFVALIRRLKKAGFRILVVYHDPDAFGGERLRDRLRRRIQLAIFRHTSQLADKVVTTVSTDYVNWMKSSAVRAKVLFVPVGSNLTLQPVRHESKEQEVPAIIVFGFSRIQTEAELIALAVMRASKEIGPLHLIVFGRGAIIVERILRPMLDGSLVSLEAYGIVEPDQAGLLFARASIQLFIRSGLSSRRGSGIAGIGYGVPIVGYYDAETAFPITEAGVRLVPVGDVESLVRELVLLLRQPLLREELRQRSLEAVQRYFSWDRIAEAYLSALTDHDY
jgi:glycosyltransferase involved in cell wall biosynthesis